MKLPRRKFLHLAAGATALPVVSRKDQAKQAGATVKAFKRSLDEAYAKGWLRKTEMAGKEWLWRSDDADHAI
jgi:hypothetical protein